MYGTFQQYLNEKLAGIRTRRGTYMTTRSDGEEECYTVYRLRSGEVTEEDVYLSVDEEYTVNGAAVDLVDFSVKILPKSFLLSILLTFLFNFIVDLFMELKLERINMAESLKSIE